jgi:glycosyltransferase involved in cell wall biosynthesis
VRILMVNAPADLSAGGAEKHVHELARELQSRGHSLAFLHAFPSPTRTYPPDTTVLHATDWREDQVRRARNHIDDWLSVPSERLHRIVAGYQPDVVHTHSLVGITTGLWEVCRRIGLPVVHTLHDYQLLCPRKTLMKPNGEPCRPHPLLCGLRTKRMTRWVSAVSDVVAVSRFVLGEHRETFAHARQHLIMHPVVPPSLRPLEPPGDRLRTLGYIGQVHVIKGVRQLIAAAPQLAERGVTVKIAGQGRYSKEAVEAARRIPGFQYVGFVSGRDKEAFLESCDAGIVPSIWNEPGAPSYTVIEWLCGGRPVLTSARGGLREGLDVSRGAIVIEPTVGGIVEAVDRLIKPEAWAAAVGNISPVSGEGEFERWTTAYETVYESARTRTSSTVTVTSCPRRSSSQDPDGMRSGIRSDRSERA